MELFTLGIDLGKTTFHLVGMNQRGEVVLRKRFTRSQLLHFTANLKVELIGMEACGGSHFLGRALREQGHEVRLIPAQYVKPYVKTNKSDYIDAEAIAEAVGRPTMRFVPVKSDDQLDLQSLHRVRERWVMRRTAVVNQIRGLLLERGTTLRKGRRYVDEALPGIFKWGHDLRWEHGMEWLKRLTVDARRDERTKKSALSALSRTSSLKTGLSVTCLRRFRRKGIHPKRDFRNARCVPKNRATVEVGSVYSVLNLSSLPRVTSFDSRHSRPALFGAA
jgi:transposase